MKITILNGEPDPEAPFEAYLRGLGAQLIQSGHQVTTLTLRDLDLKGCSGCWGCWVKTPGRCLKRDDSGRICQAVLDSNLFLLASQVHMGFTSSLLKGAVDQMIPLLHPFLQMEGGEMHHRRRYPVYPRMGLLLAPGPDTDAEDLELTRALWARTARNFKSDLAVTAVAGANLKEVADEIAAVA